jgi:hypothetical protein
VRSTALERLLAVEPLVREQAQGPELEQQVRVQPALQEPLVLEQVSRASWVLQLRRTVRQRLVVHSAPLAPRHLEPGSQVLRHPVRLVLDSQELVRVQPAMVDSALGSRVLLVLEALEAASPDSWARALQHSAALAT